MISESSDINYLSFFNLLLFHNNGACFFKPAYKQTNMDRLVDYHQYAVHKCHKMYLDI